MPKVVFGKAAADAEDEIRVGEEFRHGARHRDAARAERQRMVSGNDDFAAEACVTGIASHSASRFSCGQALA